jgi:hypothetical protein
MTTTCRRHSEAEKIGRMLLSVEDYVNVLCIGLPDGKTPLNRAAQPQTDLSKKEGIIVESNGAGKLGQEMG